MDAVDADFTRHTKRAAAAWSIRDRWQKVLMDAYDYLAPGRLSTRWMERAPNQRVDRIFDPCGVVALEHATARLEQDLFPPGERFAELALGPYGDKLDNADDLRKQLEGVNDAVHACFQNGDWDQVKGEAIGDALLTFGVFLIIPGEDKLPVFVGISCDEVATDDGPTGEIAGVFWKRKWTRRNIKAQWPKGEFDDSFGADSNDDEELTLSQDAIYDREKKRWATLVYVEKSQKPIWKSETRTNPFIVCRYRKLPGQSYGFGPGLMALPTVKTANKAVELTLKAAALTMGGIYTYVDDGVFNPDTARIDAATFWAVARNGGPLGPSLQKLEPPGDINVSNIVLQELRQQVSSIMGSEQLPPDTGTPRSAAEIVERIKRLATNRVGAAGRLMHEMTIPTVRRVLEILEDAGVLKAQIKIDQLLVRVKVSTPVAMAFAAERAQRTIDWIQIIEQLGGPGAARMVTPLEATLAEIGHELGVPAHRVLDLDEQQAMQANVAALVQAQVAAMQKAHQIPPPANGDPAQGMRGKPNGQ